MEDNKDIQIQVKKIPAFTVLKNGSILKNIFLLRKKSSQNQESDEEILLVGRHPDCHITLEHPSISRYHLRIHSNPSSHILSLVDLSSVHGTWVSGRRIEPGVHVTLKEGDTVKIGGSSRVYELHWVPLTQAYNVDEQFVPAVYTIKEGEEEEETHQDEKHEAYSLDDDLECSDLNPSTSSVPSYSSSVAEVEQSFALRTSNENDDIFAAVPIQAPLVVSETVSATQVSDGQNESEDQLNWLTDNFINEFELLSHKIIKEDLVSVPNCSKFFCDDTKVEYSISPLKTDNGNGESFTTVSIQAPLVASEAVSETESSDCPKESEDELDWLRDNLSDEFDQISHGSIIDDLVSFDLSNAIKTHENDALNQVIERSNETDIDNENEPENRQNTNNGSVPVVLFDGVNRDAGCEFEQMNQTKMMDESACVVLYGGVDRDVGCEFEQTNQKKMMDESVSMVLYDVVDRDVGCEFEQMNQKKMMDEFMVLFDGVDMGVKSDSVDHEMMKKESVFMLLPDVTDMDQEKTLTPDISKAKEIHMNIQSMQNGSASMKLFDSSGGKELEFYTPDKENKNPNACSGESFSKKAVISTIYGEKDIFGFSQKLFVTDEGMDRKQEVDPFVNCEEVLAPSGKENKSRQMIMEGSCNSISYPQTVQKVLNSSQILAKKRWTMVVDTNSLLDHKSFKHLKLLEGIGGTRLFVPKLVVNELMDIKSQDSFFKRKKVSLALKWIEECMMNTRWWIHMDDEIVHSSMAVPEVLEIALHLHKQVTDKKIIILSNDLTLKIKAMAEGIICEAAEEFRESLVNPFSERFMWVGSSARGLTWSCVDDDDIVRQKYHGFGLNGSHGFKGLKLLARAKTGQLVTA